MGTSVLGSAFDMGLFNVPCACSCEGTEMGFSSPLFSLAKNSIVNADLWEKLPEPACCHGNPTPPPPWPVISSIRVTTGELAGWGLRFHDFPPNLVPFFIFSSRHLRVGVSDKSPWQCSVVLA